MTSDHPFKEFLSHMHLGYLRISPEGRILSSNSVVSELLGYPEKDLLEKNLFDELIFVPSLGSQLRTRISVDHMTLPIKIDLRSSEDDPVTVTATFSLSFNSEHQPEALEAILLPVSVPESDSIQERIYALDRAGVLARRVSHDISNKLTAVTGYTELALLKLSGEDKISEYVERIRKSAKNALDDLMDLKLVYALQTMKPIEIDLGQYLIEELPKLHDRHEQMKFTLKSHEKQSCIVLIDQKALRLVVQSLVENACDVQPDGGKVGFQLSRSKKLPDELIEDPNRSAPSWIILSVTDTGPGLTEEVQAQMFSPFYSSKYEGITAGIGLPLVEYALFHSGGYVSCFSKQGVGTTISLAFPEF